MSEKKKNAVGDLTPATLENMPIGQKITAFEQILNDQARLNGCHKRRKEFENLEFGSHRIDHAPMLGMGAFWSGAVRLGLKRAGGAIMLEHHLVFLF